jgi:methylthioribose-1-phosphate isomerase
MLPTIEWQSDAVVMIDQRKLPSLEVYVRCKTAAEVARAIKTMVIRGAPAIGVAAAMGIALGMRRSKAQGTKQFAVEFNKLCDLMAGRADGRESLLGYRPHEAIVWRRRPIGRVGRGLSATRGGEAIAIHDEDSEARWTASRPGRPRAPDSDPLQCRSSCHGRVRHGARRIRAAAAAARCRRSSRTTRLFLQGGAPRLWELVRDQIATTVITESMAGR